MNQDSRSWLIEMNAMSQCYFYKFVHTVVTTNYTFIYRLDITNKALYINVNNDSEENSNVDL